ncbi:MAG: hypothetical protein JSV52_11800 [Candidatus Zixiibacteriota bacterium]|nr:MAG: hypothetical protein JSV52_11800 [candidate division Zixibacteria bacterium]
MRETHTNWILAVSILVIMGLIGGPDSARAAETCYDCHKDAKERYSKFDHKHKPVEDQDCERCHKPHGFAQELILKNVTSGLCYSCHPDLEVKYNQGEVHFPVAEGKCWDCHNPHGSNNSKMIRSIPEGKDRRNLCEVCHEEIVKADMERGFVHAPFEQLECMTCHASHNSPHAGLFVSELNTLCGSCHDVNDNAWLQTHESHSAIGLPCGDCHSGHSSDTKGLMADNAHAPFASGDCEICHSLPDAEGKIGFEEGVTPGQVCGACHDDIVDMTSAAFPHPAVEAENCDNCHDSHSSRFDHLLKTDQATICGECHEDVLTGTGKTPHVPAVTGDCGSCHDVHGSSRDGLVKTDDASLCLDCHKDFAAMKDAAAVIHAAVDDCLGCHSPHEGWQAGILSKEPDQLCRDCHEIDREALTAESGHQPYLTGNCADCHLPHFSRSAHLVEGGVDLCLNCHVDVTKRLEMAVPHAPAVDDCQACHAPHYADNLHLLTSGNNDLCSSCHDFDELNLTESYVHTSAKEGDCTGCHNPHGGNEDKLVTGRMTFVEVAGLKVGQLPKLTGVSSDLCYTCHKDLVEKFRQQNAHAPVAEGDCDACHAAHGSPFPGFVTGEAAELCGTCHALDDSLFVAHGGYDLTIADCLDCHNPHISDQPKLVRNLSHPPFAEGDCESCHEKDAENKMVPVGEMTEICSACHESVSEGLEMKYLHGPFAGDDCGGCHRLHTADNENLLKAQGGDLCLSCHDDLKDMQHQTVIHDPFERGECLQCHRPHASPYAALTTRPSESLCFSCHEELGQQIAQGEPHAPAVGGECGSCHLPHAGQQPALLTQAKSVLCGDCHDMQARELRTAHKGFSLDGVDCQSCHAAHAGVAGSKGLLLPDSHAPFADGDCTTCHDGLQPHRLVSGVNQLCFACHEDFVSEATSSVVHAPLQQDEGCVGCHGPHVGYGSSLLYKQGIQLCLACHDNDDFEGTIKHAVAFEDCGNCHEPHTSTNEGLLLAADVIELCTSCHDDAVETHYHPMGAGVTDPRTQKVLSCVGCHSAHSSDHAAILVAEKGRKLCIICHTFSG